MTGYMSGVVKLGDRISSDVIVRLRIGDEREKLFYTHSAVIGPKCNYFSTCLLPQEDKHPSLNSKFCIELACSENEFDYHVMLLRLLYAAPEESLVEIWHNVRNALGILKLALKLGCHEIVNCCVQYLESVPWEESEEEEIIRTLPALGPIVLPVLARLQPVQPDAAREVFLSALQVAAGGADGLLTGGGGGGVPINLKTSAQEQVEYMLTEDDDAPLIIVDCHVRSQFKKHFRNMFQAFVETLTLVDETETEQPDESLVLENVSDLVWAARVLPRVELLEEIVSAWSGASRDIVNSLVNPKLGFCFWSTKLRVVEITSKVLEAVGYGNVVLHCQERTRLMQVWLPYIREVKPQLEEADVDIDKVDSELWHNIECAMTSLVLSLPSGDQADILADWLKQQHGKFPDLSEAFEVWCFRSKAAKRRLRDCAEMN